MGIISWGLVSQDKGYLFAETLMSNKHPKARFVSLNACVTQRWIV